MLTQSEKYQNFLSNQCNDFNIELTPEQCSTLIEYMRLILQINKQINLTRIVEPNEFIEKHLFDSLIILPYIKKTDQNIIDIGTGGGFPGIPLAVKFPQNKFVLLDSTAKKLKVIEEIAKELKINNITFVHSRAETASNYPAYRDHFDYAVSRAVAQLQMLVELCLPFVKVGGEFIDEIINLLNGEVDFINEYKLPLTSTSRVLIDIVKKDKTPKNYPRKFAVIKNGLKNEQS